MKIAVVVFPGSSGADDVAYAYREILGQEVVSIWHQEETLKGADVVVVPGGASFGDYLRPGALVMGSPICGALRKFSRDGGPMLGIGNGFQILCELKILPGVLLQNTGLSFLSKDVFVSVDNVSSPFMKGLKEDQVLTVPLACGFGRYYADKRTLKDAEENGNIAFRYCDREGDIDLRDPFNGCLNAIAGVTSRHHNVLGVMFHPERAVEASMGSTVGLPILKAVLK